MNSQQILTRLKQRYPHQPEFLQAVVEFLEDIETIYDNNQTYQAVSLLERLTEPDRIIEFRVNWEDDNGNLQVNRGWRVQFNNALGPYKGAKNSHLKSNQIYSIIHDYE